MWKEKFNKKIYVLFFSLGLLFFGIIFPKITLSQEEFFFSQSAIQLRVDDKEAKPGDILVKKEGKLKRAENPYDKDIFGVVATSPIITIGQETPESLPIITHGIALVRVTAENDKIKEGDYLTSSDKKGVAKKASYPGFVLGKALEDFEEKEGLIKVFVYPHEANFEPEKSWQQMSFWEAIGRIISALEKDVPNVLRYIFALAVAAGSFLLGFRAFISSLREGIKGISRNPLAKGSIRLSMILNLIGIAIVTLAGLALSLFIIIL